MALADISPAAAMNANPTSSADLTRMAQAPERITTGHGTGGTIHDPTIAPTAALMAITP